jgi:oligopeptidase A
MRMSTTGSNANELGNPLLSIDFQVPFDRIRAADVQPAVTELLNQARSGVEAIAAAPGERTFDNTMRALDTVSVPLDYAMAVVRHLEAVATYPELRSAYNAVQPEVSAFYSSIPLHAGLWNALKSFRGTEEGGRLAGERRRFLEKTIDAFRRHGADLDPEGKARLEEIDVELSRLTTKFSENVLDSTNAFELVLTEEKDVAGLPPTALASARQSAARKGREGWRFTLQAPDYFAVTTYLDKTEIRRQLYEAYSVRATQGEHDNRSILARVLELRHEKAKLLGFADFADLVLEDRMAHKGGRALEFLEDLKDKTEQRFREEAAELLAFRRSIEGAGAPELEPWDVAYYAEKQRAALYDFDEEALRPYFPLERVMAGLFELVNRLYGIRVTPRQAVPVWDPEVRYYEIYDENGRFLGGFYTDWYPRENKRGGAWADSILTGGPAPDGFHPHLGMICGNLTPPVERRPALLTHREVETIFHEFGHLLHHLLSEVEIRSLAGTNVAWDFVELPSQIMENWCWEREALDLFARHWETGEPVPDALFQKMKRARTFRAATGQMRQLGFGFVDLLLHVRYRPERDGDVVAYTRRTLQEFSPAKLPADHAMIAAFTHLFGSPVGYGAGYYSYKWAEVLDADAFTRFRERGIFSREVGSAFRANILSKGDSDDPAQLYRQFMGRDPDPRALLERSGLLAHA